MLNRDLRVFLQEMSVFDGSKNIVISFVGFLACSHMSKDCLPDVKLLDEHSVQRHVSLGGIASNFGPDWLVLKKLIHWKHPFPRLSADFHGHPRRQNGGESEKLATVSFEVCFWPNIDDGASTRTRGGSKRSTIFEFKKRRTSSKCWIWLPPNIKVSKWTRSCSSDRLSCVIAL